MAGDPNAPGGASSAGTPAAALTALTALNDRLMAEGMKALDRVTVLSDARLDDVVMSALAAIYARDRNTWGAVTSRWRAIHGMGRHVSEFDAAVAALARQRMSGASSSSGALRVVGPGEQDAAPRDLSVLLEDLPDCPPNLRAPPGWRVTEHGVFRVQRGPEGHEDVFRTTHAPVVIYGRLRDYHDDAATVHMAWYHSGRWHSRAVPREVALDKARLAQLARYDAPVSTSNASAVVDYLDAFEAHNREAMTQGISTTRMGWLKGHGFLYGRYLLSTPGAVGTVVPVEESGGLRCFDGWSQAGTMEGWLDMWRELEHWPIPRALAYASLASPLLSVIGAENFVVHVSGDSSRGKSTSLKIAASLWGCPAEPGAGSVLFKWDQTVVGLEHLSGTLRHLPIFLDETQTARHPSIPGDWLYQHHAGEGRIRGKRSGGLQSVLDWRAVLLSTGEHGITSATNKEGAHARALNLADPPFGPGDQKDLVAIIETAIADHHGHVAREMLSHLASNPADGRILKARYRELRARYRDGSTGGIGSRLSEHIAAIETAAEYAHRVCGLAGTWDDAIDALWATAKVAAGRANRSTEALRQVYAWAVSNQHRFVDRGDSNYPPSLGWAGRWEDDPDNWDHIAFIPTILDAVLKGLDFNPSFVRRAWAERGWLIGTPGRSTHVKRVMGSSMRCVCIRRDAIMAAELIGPDHEVAP